MRAALPVNTLDEVIEPVSEDELAELTASRTRAPRMTATTFEVAGPVLHASGWRPFPADAAAKKPSITGWNLLCRPDGWMTDDELQELIEACGEDACSIAITPDLFVVDMDEERPDSGGAAGGAGRPRAGRHAARCDAATRDRPPLRVYRQAVPGSIRIRHLYRLDLLGAGGAQFVAFGLHKSGRPYEWIGGASPLTMRPDDPAIPAVTRRPGSDVRGRGGADHRATAGACRLSGAARRLGRPLSAPRRR